MKLKKKRIRKVLTVLAVIAMIVAFFLLDTENHNVLAILIAIPAETWLTFWAYSAMSDDDGWWR